MLWKVLPPQSTLFRSDLFAPLHSNPLRNTIELEQDIFFQKETLCLQKKDASIQFEPSIEYKQKESKKEQ